MTKGNKLPDFERVQNAVRWHYQWVVLHDFLPTVAGQEVVHEILPHLKNGTSIRDDEPRRVCASSVCIWASRVSALGRESGIKILRLPPHEECQQEDEQSCGSLQRNQPQQELLLRLEHIRHVL